jgi:hypothetical protein
MKTESSVTRPTWFQVKRKLPFLIEFGNEDDVIALAKIINPNVSEDQQKRIIKLFLDAKVEHGLSR